MGCCKCEEFRWPDPQEVVWTDEDGGGKEYCVFHAPKDQKTKDEHEFITLIQERIEASKQTNTPCRMTGAIFPHFITFQNHKNANALPEIYFDHAIFEGEAFFTHTHFEKHVSFEHTKFVRGALFNASHFFGTAIFYKTEFLLHSSFNNATFDDRCDFSHTRFMSASFLYTEFINDVDFLYSEFINKSAFSETTFNKKTKFFRCKVMSMLEFLSTTIAQELLFERIDNISRICFTHTSLKNISFQNINWPRHPADERYTISAEEIPDKMKSVAEFYRQMKKRNRDEQDDAEASLWHYAEKEVQLKLHRLEKPYSFQRFMLETYRIISRYGEDPWQAFRIFLYLLVGLFFSLCLGSLPYFPKYPADITWSNVAGFFHCFFQYALLDKPTYLIHPGFAALALLFSRLLIPIQAAIFAFALRNKLHR